MILRLFLGMCLLWSAVCRGESAAGLSSQQVAEGWLVLFDGHTMFGWRPMTTADWRVDDGSLTVSTGQPGLLRTTSQFDNFELALEFRAQPTTNSGVFVRTAPAPRDPLSDCLEINIAPPDNPFPTGSIVGRVRADSVPTTGAWQAMTVRVEGSELVVTVDHVVTARNSATKPRGRGFIGLQFNSGRVAFRNVRLRPLGLQPIFNGRDLSGWQTYPAMESRFSVPRQGELHVAGGRGQLETIDRYGDFVMQLECQTHAAGLNSGVFFRCIPGDIMMGYECQIHHGFLNDDRGRPADCGTGGFFRRSDARRIVANDQEWFTLTLLAEGPHLASWVNGFPVADWTDTRSEDENPRKGRRFDPGTIMLQGHDPTTDISFRNLRIAELAPRER